MKIKSDKLDKTKLFYETGLIYKFFLDEIDIKLCPSWQVKNIKSPNIKIMEMENKNYTFESN